MNNPVFYSAFLISTLVFVSWVVFSVYALPLESNGTNILVSTVQITTSSNGTIMSINNTTKTLGGVDELKRTLENMTFGKQVVPALVVNKATGGISIEKTFNDTISTIEDAIKKAGESDTQALYHLKPICYLAPAETVDSNGIPVTYEEHWVCVWI